MGMVDESFGIKNSPGGFFLTLFQLFLTMTNTCLIQRFVFHVDEYPEVLTGGILWFKDLSMIDPFYILPLINFSLQVLSIYVNIFSKISTINLLMLVN